MAQPTRNPRRKPLPPVPQTILTEAQRAGLLPLDWMLSVVRDLSADPARRDRMAIAAAQYCHPRAVEFRQTQKAHQARAASEAGAGTPWEGDLDGGWAQ